MTNVEFERKMKEILLKAAKASGMSLDWQLVSSDTDCVADFGCDIDGCLVILGDSFPLKISEMTNIRYRWHPEVDYIDFSDCFFRFDFGKNIYLDCCFGDCETGHMYHIRYNDTLKQFLKKNEAIGLLNELVKTE